MFDEIKKKVIKIINSGNYEEITMDSNNKKIGIYMIYVNNFEDKRIIPIYIGQTGNGKNRNFKNRYKEHLQEIMALNRFKYEIYKENLLENFYDGHYKACKIFQYMIDNNCTLKDFRMIVLEELDETNSNIEELLDEKEQEYFSKFLPAFFGFNQVNTVTELAKQNLIGFRENKDDLKINKILKYELEDTNNFIKYFGYGYTKFNYYHCFPINCIFEGEISLNIQKQKEILKKEHYDENKFSKCFERDKGLKLEKEEIIEKLKQSSLIFNESYGLRVKRHCAENDISISQKYDDIKRILLYENEELIEKFKKYLKRKKISVDITEIILKEDSFIKWRENHLKLLQARNEIINEIYENTNIKRKDDLMRLLPKKSYICFPLKDMYEEIKFGDIMENKVIINFEFSNNGLSEYNCGYCNLLKMDYKYKFNDEVVEKKNIFIKSEDFDNIKNLEDVDYYEKDCGNPYQLFKIPFQIRRYPDYISTSMEVQNGINEFTLLDKMKFDFKEVLDEINSYMNEYTKVEVLVRSRMKSKCKEYIETFYKKDNLIKDKIIKFLDRH